MGFLPVRLFGLKKTLTITREDVINVERRHDE
jgi:hypothetical protein